MKRMKKCFHMIGVIFRLFFAACVLSLMVTGFSTGKPVIFGIRPMFVPTDSMYPAIQPYSLILTRPIDAEDVRPGLIVTYTRNAQLVFFPQLTIPLTVVHRVVRIDGNLFYFRGDNDDCYADSRETDPAVGSEAIGYEVIMIIPIGCK